MASQEFSEDELDQKAKRFLLALYNASGDKVGVCKPCILVDFSLGNTIRIDLVVSSLERKGLVTRCVAIMKVEKFDGEEKEERPGVALTEKGLNEAKKAR